MSHFIVISFEFSTWNSLFYVLANYGHRLPLIRTCNFVCMNCIHSQKHLTDIFHVNYFSINCFIIMEENFTKPDPGGKRLKRRMAAEINENIESPIVYSNGFINMFRCDN